MTGFWSAMAQWLAYCVLVVFWVVPLMLAYHAGWNRGFDERKGRR